MRYLNFLIFFLISFVALAVTENTGHFDNLTTNNPAKTKVDVLKTVNLGTTDGVYLPNGTTGQRPTPIKDGMLRFNSTLGQAEIYIAGSWTSVGGGLSAWVTAKAYVVGDIVIQSNKIYKALIAHTSGTFATDLAANDWVEVSAPQNLTGPITSSNGVTSVASQTGTGSTFVMKASPDITAPTIDATSAIRSGSADPTSALGVAAPLGSLYLRNNGTIWVKKGAGDTLWAKALVPELNGTLNSGFLEFLNSIDFAGAVEFGDPATTVQTADVRNRGAYVWFDDFANFGEVRLKMSPSMTNFSDYTWPLNNPTNGQHLVSDASGQWSWSSDIGTATATSINGTAIPSSKTLETKNTLTTKGDMYVATGATTTVRQAIGNDGQILIADSGTTTGVRYGYEYERNYIANPGAETDTTGWANFSTTFTNSVPAALTGGTPATNIARTTSSPLNDNASFLFSKTGTTSRLGEGFSYAFTINAADTTKVLRIDFNYSVTTNYADNDMTCWIHDGTSMIQPSAFQLKKVGGIEPASMEFQATTSTSYRFGCLISSSSALDYDVKFDKFKIWKGPKVYSKGEILNTAKMSSAGVISDENIDWLNGNCTLSNTSHFVCPIVVGKYTVTPNCWLDVRSATSGTITETHFMDVTNSNTSQVAFDLFESGVRAVNPIFLFCVKTGVDYDNATSGRLSSDQADTRVISFTGVGTGSTQALTASTTNIAMTTVKDSHGAWTGSTYVVPVPGDYNVSAFLISGASTFDGSVYVNGTLKKIILGSTSGLGGGGSTILENLKASDIISIRSESTITLSGSSTQHISISKLQGPSQIAASETVSASYWLSANQALTANVTPIIFDSKEWDSHGAYSTSTGRFTAPISGIYSVTGNAFDGGTATDYRIYKNGSLYKELSNQQAGHISVMNGKIKLLAGEFIEIRSSVSVTVTGGTISSSGLTFVNFDRVGNY